jgi:prevent-host-death family protein
MVLGLPMKISVNDAVGQLDELVRRAEAGDEVILTRCGRAVVRLVPALCRSGATSRRELLEAVRAVGHQAAPGPNAARSQDFLYSDDGLTA